MMDADGGNPFGGNITESARGTLNIRAGASGISLLAGNLSSLTLNLGYHNPFSSSATYRNEQGELEFDADSRWYWRAPDRYAGGTLHLNHQNLEDPNADPEDPVLGGRGLIYYSQGAPESANRYGTLGYGAIIPYATVSFELPDQGSVVDFASFAKQEFFSGNNIEKRTLFADASGIRSLGSLYDTVPNIANWSSRVDFTDPGYFRDTQYFSIQGSKYSGTLTTNSGGDFRGARSIAFFSNAAGDNVLNLGTARLALGTFGPDNPANPGVTAVEDGGAILISNTVTRIVDGNTVTPVVRNQVITGGSLTSATASTYFSAGTMVGPYTFEDKAAATSTDLIIHNYNFSNTDLANNKNRHVTIESPIVNFQPGTPLNLVLSGPGTTRLTNNGNTYTGATYVNQGTLWLQSTAALGDNASSGRLYLNGGTIEWASTTPASRDTSPLSLTLSSSRSIVLGGNGGYIKTSAPGTVLTFGGVVRAEDYLIPVQLLEHQMIDNIGVGDLVKTGPGRMILTNSTPIPAYPSTNAGMTHAQWVTHWENYYNTIAWNAYYGITEVLGGALELHISHPNSGILGSHYNHLDGTRIASGGRLDLQITGGVANGTQEWFDLAGGTLGTTAAHLAGRLDGVIRFSADSTINITQGSLSLNENAGFIEGTGKMTKTGAGTLYLYENNATFSGDIEINKGAIIGASQGLPFGAGDQIWLGDSSAAADGNAGLFLQARAAAGQSYKASYEVAQDIIVRAEGGLTQQDKVIGVINTGTASIVGGAQNDRYLFSGGIQLNDNLILRYTDDAINTALVNVTTGANVGLRGGRRSIALAGNLSGLGNIQTEVVQNGGTVNGADPDQIITFELGGDNNAWTGGIRLGNRTVVDNDRQHVLRIMSNSSTNSNNRVTLDYNAILQVGGGTVTIGSLMVGDPTGSASTNQVFVENAASSPGTLVVNQKVNETWDVIFRDGTTPTGYYDFDTAAPNAVLNLVKTGSAIATMTQANTYTGYTHVGMAGGPSGGTLRLASGGSIVTTSPLTVFAGTFELSGVNQVLTQVLTLGGGAAGTKASVKTNSNTLTLNNNVVYDATNNPAGAEITGNVSLNNATRTFTVADSLGAAIDLSVGAVLSGANGSVGLIKAGAGTMSLSGASTYAGGTTINGGTLLAMNSLNSATGSGAVTVQPGATLGGIGTISGDVNFNGSGIGSEAFLVPGSPTISSGIEVLTLSGAVSLNDFTIVDFYLGETGWTKLFAGTLNVSSGTKFRINLNSGYVPSAGASFDLIDWGGVSGDADWADNLILPSLPSPGTLSWLTNQFTSQGILAVSGTATQVAITTQPKPVTADPGVPSPAMFVELSGTAPWLLQWQRETSPGVWQNVPGATGLSFSLPYPLEADEGNYRVRVTNGFDPVESVPAFLTVNDTPSVLAFTRDPAGNVNPGQSVVFTVEATINATDYEWRLNGQPIIGAPNAPEYVIESVTQAHEGEYTVRVSNASGGNLSAPLLLVVNDSVVITANPQNQYGIEGSVVTFSVTATGAAPISYQWQFRPASGGSFTNVTDATGSSLNRTVSTTTEGSYRVVVTNPLGPVTSSAATLQLVGPEVNIVNHPQHAILVVGQPLVLNCLATGAQPLKYQWRRNGANISGATQPTYSVPAAAVSHGGVYTCLVRNSFGGVSYSAPSGEARVAVVNTTPRTLTLKEGVTASFSISAGGPVKYQWYFFDLPEDGSGPQDPPFGDYTEVTGATSSVYKHTGIVTTDYGLFYCKVSLVDAGDNVLGSLEGGVNKLIVYNHPPELLAFDLPETVISEEYGENDGSGFISFQVPFDDDPTKAPISFTAKGLPPGLKIDNQGRIYGRATASKQPAVYTVTITAKNGSGSSAPAVEDLMVYLLNGNLVGVFTGPVNPNLALNGDLGGKLDFTSTVKGSASGKLQLGTTKYSFKTSLNTDVDEQGFAGISVEIKRKNTTPLTLEFTLDAAANRIIDGSVTDGGTTTQVGGWRNTWVKTNDVPKPAASVEGYYTFQMGVPPALQHVPNTPLPPSDPKWLIPQGFGFGSFTVNGATGKATIKGRLPDGTAYTSATFVGPLYDDNNDTIADKRELLQFSTLYAANMRGSALGVLKIVPAVENINNTLEGAVNWWRPASPAASMRVYKAGFDAFDLTVEGSRYEDPKKLGIVPPIVMDLDPNAVTMNSKVSFFHANVEAALPPTNFVDLLVNAANKAIVAATSANERKTSLSITAKTGALKGSFTLKDTNPFPPNPAKPATITRKVSYQGLIVKTATAFHGVGYFLLPQMPTSTSEAPSKTPMLSGQMLFTKEP